MNERRVVRREFNGIWILLLLLLLSMILPTAYSGGPDNPLSEASFTFTGNGGVVVEGHGVITNFVASVTSTVSVTTIPAGSTVVQAFLYSQAGSAGTGTETGTATINSVDLGTLTPISSDQVGLLDFWHKVYRWDATGVVTGNGDYTITTTYAHDTSNSNIVFHELVIIFSNPSSPFVQIILNDGADHLSGYAQSTTFPGVSAAPVSGTLIISVAHGNVMGEVESLSFNGVGVASGELWDSDHGAFLDIDIFSVTPVAGDNTATVTTATDGVTWFLAILVAGLPPVVAEVPEFGAAVPVITSVVAVIYFSLRRLKARRTL